VRASALECGDIAPKRGNKSGDAGNARYDRLVLYLTQGDIAIFRSDDITHLNLHYQGKWASIVLHSDKEMRQWLRDRNGWADNETMRTYDL
jgi:hypothetical protein